MKLKIQYKPIQDLIPYARNSRTHDDAQVAQIAASIKEFGWTNPVLLDGENGIIAGHGRVMAASKLGEKEVPTIELSHMDDNQKRAYIIADNKLALNAGWDNQMLALELQDLSDAGYDLGLTGFDLDEISALNGDENKDEDFKEPIDESRNLLMIECIGEQELQKLYEEMQQRGFECKILS
jgi:ParB-like chromosome segregation protein Spo0J